MKDIAEGCGVSTATVSYVLNDAPNQSISAETRKRVLHFANMVGYVSSASARALATGKTNSFGVYVPHVGNSAGKQRLLQALAEEAEKAGHQLVLFTGRCLTAQVTNVDAVFAIDISQEDFSTLGNNCFIPLLYLDGQLPSDNVLFYCFFFDAEALRERALGQSGCSKAVLVCDEVRNRNYKAYLEGCFDRVIGFEEAAAETFDGDTVLLLAQPWRVSAKSLLLGSDSFPLPYEAYAQAVIATALKAIARRDTPVEHHIRIS